MLPELWVQRNDGNPTSKGCSKYSFCLIFVRICDWILENGSKSHIFISVYLSLQHEKYYIPNNIS